MTAGYFWVMPLILLIKIVAAIVRSQEMEMHNRQLQIASAGEKTDPTEEKEKMTPTYMPPPREAGDGRGSNPKGDTK